MTRSADEPLEHGSAYRSDSVAAVAAGGAGWHRHLHGSAGATAAALGLVFFAPAGSLARALAIGLVAAAVGFGLIAWRTANLPAPTLSRPLFNINVEGRIDDIQHLPVGVRTSGSRPCARNCSGAVMGERDLARLHWGQLVMAAGL